MVKIEKIVNRPVPSNCYVITNEIPDSCVIVDPGTEDCKELLCLLQERNLSPEYVILTHEHIDHIIGITELLMHYKVKLICSEKCNNNINSLKYNLTGYSEKFEEKASMPKADILLESINYKLQWGDSEFQFHKAEGHSMGSIFFNIGHNLIIGDTLIKGYRTNTVLPGASKEKLITTLESILALYDSNTTRVYSGHDEDFYLSEMVEDIHEQIEYLRNKIQKRAANQLSRG